MGACSEIWTSTQFVVSMLQTSNLAVLLILFCSFHFSRIVPSIRFTAGSVTWSTVCLRSSIYSEEVTTHVHGGRVRSLKSDIFDNFRICQFHNHAQSLKSLNSNMAGRMEDCSISQSALVRVRKPDFGSFCCGQPFIGQVWLSSGPPEFLTFSYCAWWWNCFDINWISTRNLIQRIPMNCRVIIYQQPVSALWFNMS